MSENRDFDYAVCKVPRKDKNGNDVTGDKIGKGGRHRSDGTYSAPVTDIQIVDEDPLQNPREVIRYEVVEKPVTRYEDLPWYGQLAYDATDAALTSLFDGLSQLAVYGVNRGCQWVGDKINCFIESKKAETKRQHHEKVNIETAHPLEQAAIQEEKVSSLPTEISFAYEQYSKNMTSEEAQKELLEAFVLYTMSARKVWRVAHSNIIDPDGNNQTGKEMIDSISAPYLISQINGILDHNPGLLDDWQRKALEEAMGRALYVDGELIPIEKEEFQKELMSV